MTEELVGPNCHHSLDERMLVTNTWMMESCPYCRAMVRQYEGFRWQNQDVMVLEDVTAIETWLDATAKSQGLVVTRRSAEESKGRFHWEVAGMMSAGRPLPWACVVQYNADTPNILELRFTSDQNGQAVDDCERLQAIFAEHGVQPHGSQETRIDWQGEHLEARWGAGQFLSTGTLSEDLFRAVVRRLDQGMRDAVSQLGRSGAA